MEITNHILSGQKLDHESGFISGTLLSGGAPKIIIIHSNNSRNFHNHADSNQRPSVHIKVDRDGLVTQLIPFNIAGSHAGAGYWEGDTKLDKKSIAIELENAGRLIKAGDKYVSAEGEFFEADKVYAGIHSNEEETSYWQKFTEKQVYKAEQLCRLLLMSYQVKYILGHEEICPGLNVDPGPAFPLNQIRNKILSEKSDMPDIEPAFSFAEGVEGDMNYARLINETFLRDLDGTGKIINIKPRSGGWYKLNIDLGGCIKEEWVRV